MKVKALGVIGVFGSFLSGLIGGWDTAIQTLCLFMFIDYISGLVVAGVFHKSPKTDDGTLESRAGWKGLIRKGYTLIIVMVANRVDLQLGTSYIRDGVCIAFMVNELISIIENGGLMGLPIPQILSNSIEILKEKGEMKNA